MKNAAVIDLESTSVDTHRAEVVQCAILESELPDLTSGVLWDRMFRPRSVIPQGAIDVHGITNEQVAQCAHFSEASDEIADLGINSDLLITFNGCAFDLPIMRRVLGLDFGGPHIDVYRVWQVARDQKLPTRETHHFGGGYAGGTRAHRYTGALGSMHVWITGHEPSGEHDAGEDCRMTLDGARVLVDAYGLDQCIAWTSGPLPGCVDWAGKLKWDDNDRAVITFGKHKGQTLDTLVKCQRGYLQWIVRGDFHESTKKIVRDALDGRTPTR